MAIRNNLDLREIAVLKGWSNEKFIAWTKHAKLIDQALNAHLFELGFRVDAYALHFLPRT